MQLPKVIGWHMYKKGDTYSYGDYGIRTGTRREDGIDRNGVKSDVTYMVLVWPYDVPATIISKSIDKQIDKRDPKMITQLNDRIEELERELEMR